MSFGKTAAFVLPILARIGADRSRPAAFMARALILAPTRELAQQIEETVRQVATDLNVKLGSVAQPLRAALTGSDKSPGIFEVVEVLGRNETLGRIDDALAAYEAERRPRTGQIVLSNRAGGPERIVRMCEERAPRGFDDIENVMPRAELQDIFDGYRKLASFDIATVNR